MSDRPRLKPLSEQAILVTGASSGIGLATARIAAARGAKVMLVARGEPALETAVAAIRESGGTAEFRVADVGDRAAVEAAVAAAVERFGRLDTVVSNAGAVIYGKLAETPPGEHERLFRTNYFGLANTAAAALPHLARSGGALVVTGSIVGDVAAPGQGAYSASKFAVKGYVEALRRELAAEGSPVSVTLVKPSAIATPIAERSVNHFGGAALLPPPLYAPETVAEAILDAAEHRRRDVTVGGIGRAQVLLAEHFPGVFDRMAGLFMPFLTDRRRPAAETPALFEPASGGRERSGRQRGRRTSLYTAAGRHGGGPAMLLVLAAAGLAVLAAGRRHGRLPRRRGS